MAIKNCKTGKPDFSDDARDDGCYTDAKAVGIYHCPPIISQDKEFFEEE